jgi:hypothetical protein
MLPTDLPGTVTGQGASCTGDGYTGPGNTLTSDSAYAGGASDIATLAGFLGV